MRRFSRTSFFVLCLFVLYFTKVFCFDEDEMENEVSQELATVSESIVKFSSSFYKHLKSEGQKAVVISPLSVYWILSFLSEGAGPRMLKKFQKALDLPDFDTLVEGLRSVHGIFLTASKIHVHTENAAYIDKRFKLKDKFLFDSMANFQAFVTNIDFTKAKECTEEINDWMKKRTHGNFDKIIREGDIEQQTAMLILNVFHFKSAWMYPFEPQSTETKLFRNSDSFFSQVPIMQKSEQLHFGEVEKLQAKFVKLPYINDKFEMIVVLPNEFEGLDKLERDFDWNLIANTPTEKVQVDLSMPKFRVEATQYLRETLEYLGLASIFRETADFSAISEEPLYVSKILQKVFVEVDEKGSEAAAATIAQMRSRRMIVDFKEFKVDRPFMFVIQHQPTRIPLFIGTVKKLDGLTIRDEL